jgi:biotin carboxyl carrier protein
MGGHAVKEYRVSVNGKNYQVKLDDPNASLVRVEVNGQAFEVTLSEKGAVRSVARPREDTELEQVYIPTVASTSESGAAAAPVSGNVQQVTAPMPGKILDIAVRIGSQVKNGDVLCNLEAMKMKSPIRSTAEGTIVQVLTTEGQNVNFGDVLFTVQ